MKERIKQLRSALKLTQSEFANKLEVTRSAVGIWETVDDRPPSAITITLICDRFNVNRKWLEHGEGEMFKPIEREEAIEQLFREVLSEPANNGEKFRKALIAALAKIPSEKWSIIKDEFEKLEKLYNDAKDE